MKHSATTSARREREHDHGRGAEHRRPRRRWPTARRSAPAVPRARDRRRRPDQPTGLERRTSCDASTEGAATVPSAGHHARARWTEQLQQAGMSSADGRRWLRAARCPRRRHRDETIGVESQRTMSTAPHPSGASHDVRRNGRRPARRPGQGPNDPVRPCAGAAGECVRSRSSLLVLSGTSALTRKRKCRRAWK